MREYLRELRAVEKINIRERDVKEEGGWSFEENSAFCQKERLKDTNSTRRESHRSWDSGHGGRRVIF